MVADRHHGDDLLAIEEQGERPLHDHGSLDGAALLIDPAHLAGEQGIIGVGPDGELVHLRMMVQPQRRFKRGLPECRPIAAYKRSSVAVLGPSRLIDCPLIVTPAPPSPD